MKNNKLISFWGFCDLGFLVWYIGWNIFHKQIPFYYDFSQSHITAKLFESPFPVFISIISLLAYCSLFYSGYLLLKRRKKGIWVAYIQCPLRFMGLIPPSLFFVTWPTKYVIDMPSINSELIYQHPAFIINVALILISELVKITSIILWHRQLTNRR